MGKRGPKAAGNFTTKGATLSAKITAETRQKLDQAAAKSGRSLSQELEARLVRSFDADEPFTTKIFGRPQTYAFFRLASEVIKRLEELTGQPWLKDRFTFDLVGEGLALLLAGWRPPGDGAAPESFPNFIGYDQSPELRAGWRAGAQRSIDINRKRFLIDMAGSVISSAIARVRDGADTTDEESRVYREAADLIGSHLAASTKAAAEAPKPAKRPMNRPPRSQG